MNSLRNSSCWPALEAWKRNEAVRIHRRITVWNLIFGQHFEPAEISESKRSSEAGRLKNSQFHPDSSPMDRDDDGNYY